MNSPLHELDNIKAEQDIKSKTLQYVLTKQKKKNYIPLSVILLTACLILSFLSFESFKTNNSSPIAYVSLDINPSLEVELDNQYNVIKASAYNDDGQKILKQSQIKGLQIQNALQILLKNNDYSKYLESGILEIGIYSPDKEISSQLESIVNNYMNKQMTSSSYHCSQIEQSTRESASNHHMSSGKYRIIENILQYTNQYSIENLNQMTIKELYDILSQYDQSDLPKDCTGHNSNKQGHHKDK